MFKLYTVESGTFPFEDYRALMGFADGANSALEFGPGLSTLALIEAGVKHILTLEHDPEWHRKAVEEFKPYRGVHVARYENVAPVALCEALEGHPQFDLAFVDSPSGVYFDHPDKSKAGRVVFPGQEDCSRLNTCLAALRHSPILYLHDWFRANERATLGRLAALGHKVSIDGGVCIARIDRSPTWEH